MSAYHWQHQHPHNYVHVYLESKQGVLFFSSLWTFSVLPLLPQQSLKLLEDFTSKTSSNSSWSSYILTTLPLLSWGLAALHQGRSVQSKQHGSSIWPLVRSLARLGRNKHNRGKEQIPPPPTPFPYFRTLQNAALLPRRCWGSMSILPQVSPGLLGPRSSEAHVIFTVGLCKWESRWELGQTCGVLWTLDLELISSVVEGKHVLSQGIHLQREAPDGAFFSRFCSFDLSHGWGLQTRIVTVVLCPCTALVAGEQ